MYVFFAVLACRFAESIAVIRIASLVCYWTLATAQTTLASQEPHSWPQLVPQRLGAVLSYAWALVHK